MPGVLKVIFRKFRLEFVDDLGTPRVLSPGAFQLIFSEISVRIQMEGSVSVRSDRNLWNIQERWTTLSGLQWSERRECL